MFRTHDVRTPRFVWLGVWREEAGEIGETSMSYVSWQARRKANILLLLSLFISCWSMWGRNPPMSGRQNLYLFTAYLLSYVRETNHRCAVLKFFLYYLSLRSCSLRWWCFFFAHVFGWRSHLHFCPIFSEKKRSDDASQESFLWHRLPFPSVKYTYYVYFLSGLSSDTAHRKRRKNF